MVKKILLGLVIAVFTVTGIIAYINTDSINMIYTAYFVSDDTLKARRESSQKELLETLALEYGIDNLDEIMTQSEEDDVAKGILSVDEIRQRLEKQRKERETLETNNQKQANCRKAVEDAIEEMYYLKATYLVELGGIEGEIISYYNSLMRQDGMTKSKAKLSVAENYTERMLRFQNKCDASVESVLSELEAVLKKNDGSTDIIGKIKAEYQSLKDERLNYYMSRYNK